MPKASRSHVKNGKAYYKNTGRYNEVKRSAIGKIINDAPSSAKQRRLVSSREETTSEEILKDAVAELGW